MVFLETANCYFGNVIKRST